MTPALRWQQLVVQPGRFHVEGVDVERDVLCSNLALIPVVEGYDFPDWAVDWPKWSNLAQCHLSPKRWGHVQRVALLAAQIAYCNGLDSRRAYAAGILHDLAREFSLDEYTDMLEPSCEMERRAPLSMHGKVARVLLERWGFTDEVVLAAVADHVTGPKASSSPVSACVYIADVSEPARGVNDDIRELAYSDLHAALCKAISSKVNYLEGRGRPVHPETQDVHAWLCECGHKGKA